MPDLHSLVGPFQDPLYAPNYYLSMSGFRELTSQRGEEWGARPGLAARHRAATAPTARAPLPPAAVAKFVGQRFFSVRDYIDDPLKFQVGAGACHRCRPAAAERATCAARGGGAAEARPFPPALLLPGGSGMPVLLRLLTGHQVGRAFHAVRRHHRQAWHREAPRVRGAAGGRGDAATQPLVGATLLCRGRHQHSGACPLCALLPCRS